MKNFIARTFALLSLITIAASVSVRTPALTAAELPANVEKVESLGGITQYRLKSNGMPIYLKPDHAAPVFTFMVVYHVGSRNEAPGNTGSAHLLEHMIFNKSTENFGRARGHKTFQEVLYEAGADFSSTNMTTWYDRMNGYSTLPSDKLELAMKIEADRLARGLILDEERLSEMSVVRNEYEIGENNPYRALYNAVIGTAIVAHPYHWSTIGYRSDIEGVTTEKLREHYRNFFHPDNAQAILVGDFDTAQALAMFDREFGSFPRSENPIPKVITVEPPQQGERRTIVRRPGSIRIVAVAWMRPHSLHPDFIPIEVLTTVLGDGVSSRLYKALVETRLATDVNALNFTLRDPFPLYLVATVAEGSDHQKVEEALKTTVSDIAANGITEAELQRAKEQIEVSVIRRRDGTYPFASDLGEAVASADWKWFIGYVDAVRNVKIEDVQRVAATYLVPDGATVGWFVPADASKKPAPSQIAGAESQSADARRTAQPVMTTKREQAVSKRASGSFASRTVRKVLENGLIVDVVENRAVPTVAVRGIVFAGDSTAAAGNAAVPRLTAMMLQRGTKTKTKQQMADLIEGRGANLSIATNLFDAQIAASGLSRDLPTILEVLADQLRNPSFPEEELVKAKGEMKNDVLRAAESTGERAVERLTQLVYPPNHPYRAHGSAVLTAAIEAATVEDLARFHAQRYGAQATILAIVGDVDAAKTIALVERLFGGFPKGSRPALETERAVVAQTATKESFECPGKRT
ncbi:MAG TPA: pitrilysin family protein [Thermoanaerobaculia bacterium]|nr:pitrilysin family protein [Thermoanaerobaculia bacterium]